MAKIFTITDKSAIKSFIRVAGVYCIKNIFNDKIYIGCSIDINKRIRTHIYLLKKNSHFNKKLQKDFNKFLIHSFCFSVLENVNNHLLLQAKKKLTNLEIVKILKNKFNIKLSKTSVTNVINNITWIDDNFQTTNRRNKLNWNIVKYIRKYYKPGINCKNISNNVFNKFNILVKSKTINAIILNKIWKDNNYQATSVINTNYKINNQIAIYIRKIYTEQKISSQNISNICFNKFNIKISNTSIDNVLNNNFWFDPLWVIPNRKKVI